METWTKREQKSSQDPLLSKLFRLMHMDTTAQTHPDPHWLCVSICVRLQPTTLSSEDAILLPQEEPGLSVEKPGRPTDQLTPVFVPALPLPPSAARAGVKRSLELEVPAFVSKRQTSGSSLNGYSVCQIITTSIRAGDFCLPRSPYFLSASQTVQ